MTSYSVDVDARKCSVVDANIQTSAASRMDLPSVLVSDKLGGAQLRVGACLYALRQLRASLGGCGGSGWDARRG